MTGPKLIRPTQIKTDRLFLRPPEPNDAPAIAAALADDDVVRWLTRAPNPYRLSDAKEYIARAQGLGEVLMIHDATGLIGCIGCGKELGYWLAKPAWGRGYITEAARAVLAEHFGPRKGGDLISGHYQGNDRSARVLDKLGFEAGPHRSVFSRSRQRNVTIIGRALSRVRYFSLQRLE